MDKKKLSERDICTKFVLPALIKAGWDAQTQIREEVSFTAGRVIVRGKTVARGKAKRADVLLHYRPNSPLALVENKDNKTKPIRIEEFELEKKWWGKRKAGEHAWKVSAAEIKAGGFNLDLKNPNTPVAGHDDPEELLAEYQKLLQQIETTRNALRDQLSAALESGR